MAILAVLTESTPICLTLNKYAQQYGCSEKDVSDE